MNNRRKLVITLGSVALAAPFGSFAQQQARVWRIGFLATTKPAESPQAAAFRGGLRDLGYIEGKNLTIEYRWVQKPTDQLSELADELVRTRVDIIFAWGTPAATAAKQATSSIPIVFAGVADPVGSGIVASLARPGGNITGMTNLSRGLTAKLVQMLTQFVPWIKHVAALRNQGNPASVLQFNEVEDAARELGLSLVGIDFRTVDDLESAFERMRKERVEGVVILSDPMIFGQRRRVAELTNRFRIASISTPRGFAEAGGLMSYGEDSANSYRRAAGHVGKILKGAKPADLPVEQPTKFELFINGNTAKALGLKIPQSLLVMADKVIE
jgi:putative ABC transport system substrate-binding protein